ncbi:MAG: hypothetical protein M1838_006205 [Thelocarpon superellum]|nr:MAG: hypothetical protein M1838_006205 [Thelocarpon superellum]
MSSPSPLVAAPAAITTPAQSVVPRKRRRRAPATGAADDCFACRKKHVKCDRRRPYCSQCLEQGKECSGYKTQLTWGVGVASRGKLRGLSLPVPRKPSTSTTTTTATATATATGTTSRTGDTPATGRDGAAQTPAKAPTMKQRVAMTTPISKIKGPAAMTNVMTYDFVNMDPTGSPTIPELHTPAIHSPGLSSPRYSWLPAGYHRIDQSSNSPIKNLHGQSYLDHNPWRFETPMASPMGSEFDLSTSASSISGFSETDMHSPMDFPPTPEDMSFMSSPFAYYGTPPPQQQALPMWTHTRTPSVSLRRAPTSYPDMYPSGSSMCSSLSSNPSQYEPVEENAYPAEPIGPCNLSDMLYDDGLPGSGTPNATDIELGFGYRMVRHDTSETPFLFDV